VSYGLGVYFQINSQSAVPNDAKNDLHLHASRSKAKDSLAQKKKKRLHFLRAWKKEDRSAACVLTNSSEQTPVKGIKTLDAHNQIDSSARIKLCLIMFNQTTNSIQFNKHFILFE